MKQVIIKPKDLEKYMGIENYRKFVDEFQARHNLDMGFWIIAEGYDKYEKEQ